MSGVYIKGRKPPTSCDDCWVSDCPNDEHIDGYRMMGRPTYCPLVPVPDHGRLIDADAISKQLEQKLNNCIGQAHAYYRFAMAWINEAPTIIPADKEGEG